MRRTLWVLVLLGCSDGEGPRDGPRGSTEDALPRRADALLVDGGRDAAHLDMAPELDAESPRDAAPDATEGAPDGTPPDARVDPPDGGSACTLGSGGLTALSRGGATGSVTVEGDPCQRTFRLRTTQALRDGVPANPLTLQDNPDGPRLRTSSPLVDALYALALAEAGENAVEAIRDGAFSNGQPVPCAPGGCYETGRLWHYVWTRDTAYATALGLASLDSQRVQNALDFKLSEPTGGGPLQIMQDTGTGGSHPISTDRVIWALGARTLLAQLEGPRLSVFSARAREAMRTTADHDRAVAFDPSDGLYRGEQSFLDWREQTYPAWTADHLAHIGMSKALSTNIAHFILLDTLADLAPDGPYRAQADALRAAIRSRFWLPEDGLFSTFITTTLDPAPARQFDLLGNALAILEGVATPEQAAEILSRYPHMAGGTPVIWPQQQFTPIYHNRAAWPFVTAFWLRAALAEGRGAVVAQAVTDLMTGAALNLSNMENLEAVSGAPAVDDGAYSGPVVNSQRQLWSVAGYLVVVHEALFGLTPTADGLTFAPAVPVTLWDQLFADAPAIELVGYPWRGRRLHVVVHRPGTGPAAPQHLRAEDLAEGTVLEANAADLPLGPPQRAVDAADYRDIFAPRPPRVVAVEGRADGLRVVFASGGDAAADLQFAVYRDGERLVNDLPGAATDYLDAAARADGPSHCYTVEARFRSGTVSQRADPACWWGPGADRIITLNAADLEPVGGQRAQDHGRPHLEVWADAGQGVRSALFTATRTGSWLIQAVYSNGAAGLTTGITTGLLRLRVEDEGGGAVALGYLPLPHTGDWGAWRDSAFVEAQLVAGTRYRILLDGEGEAYNMSIFQHFRRYTGGLGGEGGPFNRANIAALKLLGR